jgi:hypothetical protein
VFAALYAAVGASLYSVAGTHWLALFWPAQLVLSGKVWGPVVVLAAFAVVAFYVYWLKWENPAPAQPWQTWGTTVAVPSILSIPPTWRRALFPRCPNCGEGGGQALHINCGKEDQAELYIDIATGYLHCIACGHESGLEGWRNHCTCAVWEGGEIWQGMAAEVGRMGDLSWLKAAGVRRGTPEISFLGWSFCLGCQRHFEMKNRTSSHRNAQGRDMPGLPRSGEKAACGVVQESARSLQLVRLRRERAHLTRQSGQGVYMQELHGRDFGDAGEGRG